MNFRMFDDVEICRQAARVVLLDATGRVLLIEFQDPTIFDPDDPSTEPFWVTPGGAIEEGESFEAAALREMAEETGILDFELGPLLWIRDARISWNARLVHVHERFFLGRTNCVNIDVGKMLPAEKSVYRQYRWWTPEEIAQSSAIIYPKQFKQVFAELCNGIYPTTPLQII